MGSRSCSLNRDRLAPMLDRTFGPVSAMPPSRCSWGVVDDGVRFGACRCTHEQTGIDCASLCASTTPLVSGTVIGAFISRVSAHCKKVFEPVIFGSCHHCVAPPRRFAFGFVGEGFRHRVLTNDCVRSGVAGWRCGSGPLLLTRILDGALNRADGLLRPPSRSASAARHGERRLSEPVHANSQ